MRTGKVEQKETCYLLTQFYGNNNFKNASNVLFIYITLTKMYWHYKLTANNVLYRPN